MFEIRVKHAAYDGDVPFPEAKHYSLYVKKYLEKEYPDAQVDVEETGFRTAVSVYDKTRTAVEVDTLEEWIRLAVANEWWEEFCSNGYKEYSEE